MTEYNENEIADVGTIDDSVRVMKILSSAEDLLDYWDDSNDDDAIGYNQKDHNKNTMMLFEPTPIGPNGVEHIVSSEYPVAPQASSVDDICEAMLPMARNAPLSSAKVSSQVQSPSIFDTSNTKSNNASLTRHMKRQRLMMESPHPHDHAASVTAGRCTLTTAAPSSSSSDNRSSNSNSRDTRHHFRQYQASQWMERFEDLVQYKKTFGHCLVPHDFPSNQKLAQWVKRQRYQYKLKYMGRHSTLTDARQQELEQMGFVWDSHQAAWYERLECLKRFRQEFGHCNVPSKYQPDRSLAIWIKCQRRQMKLYRKGKKSTMTPERSRQLDRLSFDWNPRSLSS